MRYLFAVSNSCLSGWEYVHRFSWSTKPFPPAGVGITSGVFSWPPFIREGYLSSGMSIFLLFLRRLWIALDANSHTVLKQCVTSNRYAWKNCENFSKCLSWGIPLERVRSCRKLLCFCRTWDGVVSENSTLWFCHGTGNTTQITLEQYMREAVKKVQMMLGLASIWDQNGSFHKEMFQSICPWWISYLIATKVAQATFDFACLPVHLANHSACQGR